MSITSIEPQGRFAQEMVKAMEAKGLGLRELATEVDGTYEHIRKLVKGIAYPSKYLLKDISKVLGLKQSYMEQLVVQDKMEHTLGDNMHVVLGRSPRMAEYDQLVPHLSEEQHDMFLSQMRGIVRMNRQKKA